MLLNRLLRRATLGNNGQSIHTYEVISIMGNERDTKM